MRQHKSIHKLFNKTFVWCSFRLDFEVCERKLCIHIEKMSHKTKMSHSRRSMTKNSSRFTDGEFPPKRQITDNLLMEYLCQFRRKNEISTDEYKEYVEQQLDQIREINVNRDSNIFSLRICV